MSSSPTAREPSTFEVWSKESDMFCTECEDTSATLLCLGCKGEYCQLCWESLHRRGARAKHVTRPLNSTSTAGAVAGVGGDRPAPEASANGSSDEGKHVVGSSDETVTKRPRARPDAHEGPLCPSGHFSSKPVRDPSVSPSAPKRAKLASPARVEVALLSVSSDLSGSEREGKGRDDGKGRDKPSRSPNSGDPEEVAKSQTLTSPGEAAKAVEADTLLCSQKADCSGVASGGSGGGCSTVAESASASLGPSTSPEREEEGRDDGKGREKRPRSPNTGDQKLIEVAKSQALSSAKAMEADTLPCSQKADCSGGARGGSGGGYSTVAKSASASLGPTTSPEREEEGRDDGKGREKRPRSANPGHQKLIKVTKSQASSSPGEAAKAMEVETSPCAAKMRTAAMLPAAAVAATALRWRNRHQEKESRGYPRNLLCCRRKRMLVPRGIPPWWKKR